MPGSSSNPFPLIKSQIHLQIGRYYWLHPVSSPNVIVSKTIDCARNVDSHCSSTKQTARSTMINVNTQVFPLSTPTMEKPIIVISQQPESTIHNDPNPNYISTSRSPLQTSPEQHSQTHNPQLKKTGLLANTLSTSIPVLKPLTKPTGNPQDPQTNPPTCPHPPSTKSPSTAAQASPRHPSSSPTKC